MTDSFTRRAMLATSGAALAGLTFPFAAAAQDVALPPVPTPDQWARSPDLSHVCLSPDGNHIAYIKEDGGKKLLYEYDIAANAFQSFNLGPAKISSIYWIDAAHLVVSTFATAKIEVLEGGRDTWNIVSVYNIRTKSIKVLYDKKDGFSNFVVGEVNLITVNGKRQITAANYPLNADDFKYLYSFDLDGIGEHMLDRAPWPTRNWVITPDGTLLGRSVYYKKSDTWVLQYYVNGTWKDIFTQKAALDYPSLVGLGRDGKSLVVFMSSGEQQGHYYEVSPDGVFSAPLDDKDGDLLFDPYTFRLAGIARETGWISYDYFDPGMQALVAKAQKAMDGYRMNIIGMAEDPNKMIVYSEGADDAGTYYFIDFTTGKTITIGQSYPQIPVEWISEKTAIKYKAADGLEIEAYLTLPPNREAKNLPLIVLPHGGPVVREMLNFDPEAQTYASLGYAVLQPNYRGSAGYGKAFVEAGYGQWGKKMQTDLSDGARFLASQGLVDLKRVCIVGASYGGYAALAGVTIDPGVYNCAVDVAGLSNLRTFLDWSRNYTGDKDNQSYKVWSERFGNDSNLDSASPIKHVDAVTVPVLIVHGKDDTVVPFDQSATMAAALKAAGKDVTFIQYDHEDHWETNASARADMYKLIVAFIEKHNPA